MIIFNIGWGGSPKVTRFFNILRCVYNTKFKMKFVNFKRFVLLLQNFINLSFVTTDEETSRGVHRDNKL